MLKKLIAKLEPVEDQNETHFFHNPITFLWGKLNTFIKDRKFKKVTKEIEEKEGDFLPSTPTYYVFFDYKMKCYFKMIKHKMSKLLQNGPSLVLNMKMKAEVELMLDKVQSNIQSTFKKAKCLSLDKDIQERLVQVYTEALYLQARYCKFLEEIPDCASYLSIGHNVLKNFVDTCKEPKTLSIYQNILLLLSTTLIEDKDFQTSIEYLKICLKLCFQEIFIRIDIERGVLIEDLPDKKLRSFNKIIKNIIICLFHIGICYENLDSLIKAIEAYKQTRFFCDKFYFFSNPIFGDIIRQNEKRAFKYYDLYLALLEEKEAQKKRDEEALRLKLLNSEKNNELTRISTGMNHNFNKYDSLSKMILSYHFPEMKTISVNDGHNDTSKDPYESTEKKGTYLLTSLNVYTDLLSKQYQSYVIENDDLNVNKFTKQTKESLDRFNTRLRIKRMHKAHKNTVLNSNSNKSYQQKPTGQALKHSVEHDSFQSSKKTPTSVLNSQKKHDAHYVSTRNNVLTTASSGYNNKDHNCSVKHYHNRDNDSNESYEMDNSCSSSEEEQQARNATYYPVIAPKGKKSPQVNLFGKKRRKKIAYLENALSKEMKFQKKLMSLLQGDSQRVIRTNALNGANTIDVIKQKEDAKSLHRRLRIKVNDHLVKEKNTFNTEIHKQRAKANEVYKKKVYALEEKAITGLNTFSLDQMQTFVNAQKELLKKAYLSKRPNQQDQFKITLSNVHKTNNDYISSLSRDIDICEKKTSALSLKR